LTSTAQTVHDINSNVIWFGLTIMLVFAAVALMAVRDINANASILPRHELVLDIQGGSLAPTFTILVISNYHCCVKYILDHSRTVLKSSIHLL
jgi:hypothetical protein